MPVSRRFIRRTALAITAAAAAVTLATSAHAQTASTGLGVGPSRFVSTNPFLPLFGFFSAEFEQRIKDNVAFALSGTHVEFDDDRVTSIDAKLRLYPNDRALEGFGVAASLGMARIKRNDTETCNQFTCVNRDREAFSTPSFAMEIGYQWLLGRTKSTAITAGLGAKRFLTGSKEQFDGFTRVLPTGRLSIGYGF